jgi:uncharacterized SAM-binding protein YcdF (DUF218 family)
VLAKQQVLAITKWGLLATTTWLGLVGLAIVRFAGVSAEQSADAAIVLGAAVTENRPSPVFQARIDHAIDLWKTQRVRYLIFTGGLGAGDTLAESQAAQKYAVTQGVPPTQIFIELKSHTTKQNLLEAQKILQTQRLASCLLVSDPLHMKRADWMMQDVGITGYPSPTPYSRYQTWQSQLPFLLREVYFYHHYWLFRQ